MALASAPRPTSISWRSSTCCSIAASFTPLPGASGAQEGGFYLFFKDYFSDNVIFAALFVWRFLTYYLSIIVGFVAVAIDGARRQAPEEARTLPELRVDSL